jgi:NTE family protein
MLKLRLSLPLAALALSACAAHYPLNKPIAQYSQQRADRARTLRPAGSSDRLFVVLTFSGGGTRAAAFAYGVLEELRATEFYFEGRRRSLIDEVDIVSGVSGGSFTAAYFGLHGHDMFGEFERRFLYRNVESALKWMVLAPRNWGKLASSNYARSDLVADYFDRHLFDRSDFLDIARRRGAGVIINATDITRGEPFSFVADQFGLICSDLASIPLARAVVASAAVPVLFSPISLRNYAGSCGYEVPPWVAAEVAAGPRPTRRNQRAQSIHSYLDSVNRPYVHLVDGGLTDNLGLRAILDQVVFAGGIEEAIRRERLADTDEILFIVVNAQSGLNSAWDKLPAGPSVGAVIEAATTVQINRYNFETVELLRTSFEQWARDLRAARCGATPAADCAEVRFHLVEINFDNVRDAARRQELKLLPTSFALPANAVDGLRRTARELLRSAAGFERFLARVGAPEVSP